MHWNLKGLLFIAVLAMVCSPIAEAQETSQTLHWRNGDVLPGRLLESSADVVRWRSPYFSDDLSVDIDALRSVIFPKKSAPATEAFRVSTVSGDVWIADIVDSDAETFLFSSERHGQFRVNRESIYALERRVHPKLIFEGSQLTNWKLPARAAQDRPFPIGQNKQQDWYADRVGHPRTDTVKAKLFHALDWPERFEIDLELASAERPPGFVFALGKNLYETLRLETWVNELVVVQGTLFEPILTIEPDRRNFRLRLLFDEATGVLEVFDFAGRPLLKLEGVTQTVEDAGPYIYNRGQNLTVRRLRVYQQAGGPVKGEVDTDSPRVRMTDGRTIYGKLFVEGAQAYLLDGNGERHDIAFDQIDRVIHPEAALIDVDHPVALTYPDGAVLSGHIVQVKSESVLLQTASVDTPIACAFAGASELRMEERGSTEKPKATGGMDRLFHSAGQLRGRVLLQGSGESLVRWQPVGAVGAVGLVDAESMRIERNNRRASKAWPVDTSQFGHVLHLKSGEIIPCQIESYTETSLGLHAPFISARLIETADVKALEFADRTHADYNDTGHQTQGRTSYFAFERDGAGRNIQVKNIRINGVDWMEDGVPRKVEGLEGEPVELNFKDVELQNGKMILMIDGKEIEFRPGQDLDELLYSANATGHKLGTKLERALTVPRFSRDTPPSHILVAENGDMKRGKLLGFNGDTLQFDSKLRRFTVPIERVTRVVEVSVDSDSDTSEKRDAPPSGMQLCARLTDGSILMFEPIEAKDGTLLGRSPIYGDVSLPTDSIQHLYFGDTRRAFSPAFGTWVVRPAQEPTYGSNP